MDFPAEKTAVVIDPPRKGCSAEFLAQLFAFGPGKVVYVSCNPATQIRDLAEFDKAGYFVTAVQPFDLFPQTKHLECVVTLKKIPDFSMPKLYIKTYGCQMNERDSEQVARMFVQKGYTMTDREDEADVILFNSCSIREQAEQKALGKWGFWPSSSGIVRM